MYQRADDNEETVRNCLDVYQRQTEPLIEYYRGGNQLLVVDGAKDPELVYADVKAALGL